MQAITQQRGLVQSARLITTFPSLGRPISTPRCLSPLRRKLPGNLQFRRWYSLKLDELDHKWRRKWKESSFDADMRQSEQVQPSKMVIPMFPYPSGTLHLGHLRVYTIADVIARYRTLRGDKILLPMGWDAFGLPAENAAIERGIPPHLWTKSNISKMKEQLELINANWSWETVGCHPVLLP